jgi:hypothetical protein
MTDARKETDRLYNFDGVTSCVYHVNPCLNTDTFNLDTYIFQAFLT